MSAGAGAGAGITGYYAGKSMRDKSDTRDYDTKRKREIEDPRKDRLAILEEEIADLENRLARAKFPGMVKGISQSDQKRDDDDANRRARQVDVPSQIQEEIAANTKGREVSGILREDAVPAAREAVTQAGTDRKVAAVNRTDAVPAAKRGINENIRTENKAVRTERGEVQEESEDSLRFDLRAYARAAKHGLENYEVSGKPQALSDAYNMAIDDDQEIEYRRSPVDANGKTSMTAWEMLNTETGEVLAVFENQDELADNFAQHWLNPSKVQEAYNMAGEGQGGRAYNSGGIGGQGGFTGRSGGRTTGAKNQEIRDLAAAWMQTEEGQGATEAEAYMYAWEKASQNGSTSPKDSVIGLYKDLLKGFTKPGFNGRLAAGQVEQAQVDAMAMANVLAKNLGVEPLTPDGVAAIEGEGGETDYFSGLSNDDIVDRAVGIRE